MGLFSFLADRDNRKHVRRLNAIADKAEVFADEYRMKSDEQLKAKTDEFRKRITENYETLDDILPEAFALVREAAGRVLGMRHFHVQFMGGVCLHQGRIAEMRTGEGKTLVSTLPAYLNALTGKGVHIVTVNDYLARRDAEWMGKVHRFLGLSVGVAVAGMSPDQKRAAYNCDITYATNNELGFDYLRDNMARYKEERVQRELNYAIIDEVDSILIDEARTPLIISGRGNKSSDAYKEAQDFVVRLKREFDVTGKEKTPFLTDRGKAKARKYFGAKTFDEDEELGKKILVSIYDYYVNTKRKTDDIDEDEMEEEELKIYKFVRDLRGDYSVDEKDKSVTLTEGGIQLAEKHYHIENLTDVDNTEINHYINNALRANYLMKLNVDYVVQNNEVIIVDEFTGRLMVGRRYSDGLHQAIEAKENVMIRNENKTLATITFQNYFRLYKKLAGMTGTAKTEEGEFKSIYGLDVVEIPTNLPPQRVDENDKVFTTVKGKLKAVVEDIEECYQRGQPVLVGTTTVEKSEELSNLLRADKVPHTVLNAKNHEKEAEIVAQAGKLKAVTIATNMAGRGTDILLGGNAEYLAKKRMRDNGVSEEEISYATSYFNTDDETVLQARATYKKYYDEFKVVTDAEKEEVLKVGGLRIIGTERHESRRIDNQLRGRAGRQGDMGSSVFYLSMEDDVVRLFGGDRMKRIADMFHWAEDEPMEMKMLTRGIANAQRNIEGRNFTTRKMVLEYDDVMNKQREIVYTERNKVLLGENVHDEIENMMRNRVNIIVDAFTNPKTDWDEWNVEGLNKEISLKLLPETPEFLTQERAKLWMIEEIKEQLLGAVQAAYKFKMEQVSAYAEQHGIEPFDQAEFERTALLLIIDDQWMEHIDSMDALRHGIGLKAYGQQDPVIAYKKEGFEMFDDMVDRIHEEVVRYVMFAPVAIKVDRNANRPIITSATHGARELAPRKKQPDVKAQEPRRNDPCPCGSGKKYKNCCGSGE